MADIASVVLAVDSSQVKAGAVSLDELAKSGAKLEGSASKASAQTKQLTSSTQALANAARQAAAVVGVGFGAQQIIAMVDEYKKFTAQLMLVSNGTQEFANSLQEVQRIAKASQADISSVGVLYSRISNATRDLGASQNDVTDITETISLALKASGATAIETASAMLQLSQAFGSGRLQGQEFMAVNESAPRLMKILADSIGVQVGALKELSSEGTITADMMRKAFTNPEVLKSLREQAAQVQTISGAFTNLRNSMVLFLGVQAQESGAVSLLTGAIGLLADNLKLLAGVMLTVTGSKLAQWLGSIIARTHEKTIALIADASAERARAVAVAESAAATLANNAAILANLAATQAAIIASRTDATVKLALANASIVSAQAQIQAAKAAGALSFALRVASQGEAALTQAMAARSAATATLATLGQQQARVQASITAATAAQTAATTAATAAQSALTKATVAGTVASGVAGRAIALLGGPIGAVITVLGLAATAWSVWGNSARDANKIAKQTTLESTDAIIDDLEKQIKKHKAIIELRTAGLSAEAAEKNLKPMQQLIALGKELGVINNNAKLNNTDKFFARLDVLKKISALTKAMKEEERLGAQAEGLTAQEARLKFMEDYATKQEKLNAKLAEARKLLGNAFTAEDEARVRNAFAEKDTGAPARNKAADEAAAANKERLDSIKSIIDALAEENFALGRSTEEILVNNLAKLNAPPADVERALQLLREAQAYKVNTDAIERQNEALKRLAEEGRVVAESVRTPSEVLNQELTRLARLRELSAFSADAARNEEIYARAVAAAWKTASDATGKAKESMGEFAIEAARSIQSTLGDQLFNILQGNFKSIGDQFKSTLDRMVADALAAQLAKKLMGDFDTTGQIGGLIGSIFGAFGGGGGVSNAGSVANVVPFAHGGIVQSKTVFPMRGGTGMMGEAGPEAIMPVKRMPGGALGVQASGGGGGGVVVNMYISGISDARGIREATGNMAARAGAAARSALARNG